MNSLVVCPLLPASNGDIDVPWRDLEPREEPVGLLAGNERGAAAEKRVEDELSSLGAIENRILDQANWFDGRMERKRFAALGISFSGINGADRGVAPDIASRSTVLAKLEVISMSLMAVLEHEDEFMLTKKWPCRDDP